MNSFHEKGFICNSDLTIMGIAEAYSGRCETPMMELFCETKQIFITDTSNENLNILSRNGVRFKTISGESTSVMAI